MNKVQFWILNIVGGVCALLILGNLWLIHANESSSQSLTVTQNDVARAQQVQTTMQNLAVRIAQAGRTESALSNLLVLHELKVNLTPANPVNAENPAQPAP